MKSIIIPIFGIVDDIIFYPLIFRSISDYMVVKPGLPGEIDIVVSCIFCYPCFISTNN